jgi:DNA-directed RNA polymerase subunit N (RpoN/RPB10)
MIIPIRCMSCGTVIADKWRYYKEQIKKRKGFSLRDESEDRFYMDGTSIPNTVELEIMKAVRLTKPCCRRHFLTHVDLIEKI